MCLSLSSHSKRITRMIKPYKVSLSSTYKRDEREKSNERHCDPSTGELKVVVNVLP